MYKIEAVIHKAGSAPVAWIRYSENSMTLKQCIRFLNPVPKSKSHNDSLAKVNVTDFKCMIEISQNNIR
jgi:hypothetical protein